MAILFISEILSLLFLFSNVRTTIVNFDQQECVKNDAMRSPQVPPNKDIASGIGGFRRLSSYLHRSYMQDMLCALHR